MKKLLSMILALAMLVGFGAVGASAGAPLVLHPIDLAHMPLVGWWEAYDMIDKGYFYNDELVGDYWAFHGDGLDLVFEAAFAPDWDVEMPLLEAGTLDDYIAEKAVFFAGLLKDTYGQGVLDAAYAFVEAHNENAAMEYDLGIYHYYSNTLSFPQEALDAYHLAMAAYQEQYVNPVSGAEEYDSRFSNDLTVRKEHYKRRTVVLQAIWDALAASIEPGVTTYTLTYNLKNGTGGPAQQTGIAAGAVVPLSTAAPTRAGYTFKGWAATDGGTTAITSVTVNADTTVYAIWEQNAVTPDPDPDPDPIFDFFANFLPESVANVLTWIVRYVFFGWL